MVRLLKVKVGMSPEIERAFLACPRELFVSEHLKERVYEDVPLPIGYGQTISQPSTVAIMTRLLDPRPGNRVLEVGTGSGWQAAILSKLVYPGTVYTVERIPELAEFARRNLKAAGVENVRVFVGDGSRGLPEHAPYDRIIVTAASPEIPEPLLNQLAPAGRMVLPVGREVQKMTVVEKTAEGLKIEEAGEFVFVPLIGAHGF